MKKIATAFIVAGLGLFALVPAAFSASDNHPVDLENGYHLKTDICHNVDHNPVVVPVSVDSADFPFDTGHGDLTLDVNHGFVSFVPHTGTGGHEHDFVVRVYIKHGNDETNTYVSESECGSEETTTTTLPTTTTTVPEVTTTTVPEVTTTTVPEVTTTTEPGVTVTTQPEVTTTAVADPGDPVASDPAATELAHTGAWSTLLILLGAAAAMLGIGLMLMSKSLKRAEN